MSNKKIDPAAVEALLDKKRKSKITYQFEVPAVLRKASRENGSPEITHFGIRLITSSDEVTAISIANNNILMYTRQLCILALAEVAYSTGEEGDALYKEVGEFEAEREFESWHPAVRHLYQMAFNDVNGANEVRMKDFLAGKKVVVR